MFDLAFIDLFLRGGNTALTAAVLFALWKFDRRMVRIETRLNITDK
jgi:hypothetical protein